jgi:dihydroorotase
LFENATPLENKKITAEVCVHHLHFTSDDYTALGSLIKCNPAIKSAENRDALWSALLDDRLDVIATDHAPHTWQEKQNKYMQAPSGLPLEQHALPLMMDYFDAGKISIEKIVEKMAHAPAVCFQIEDRGFIREGYYADLVELKKHNWKVQKSNILSKCGWSPFEGHDFTYQVNRTFVNGGVAYENRLVSRENFAKRLQFKR